jgi:hypothetical protein
MTLRSFSPAESLIEVVNELGQMSDGWNHGMCARGE